MKTTLFSLLTFCVLLCQACQPAQEPEAAGENPDIEPKITPAMAEDEPLIQHIVCFKFQDNASPQAVEKHMQDFAGLKNQIPEIQAYEEGTAFTVSYEKTADYDVVHYVTFANKADLETYFHHPAHQQFVEENKDVWAGVFVINADTQQQPY